MLKNKNKVLKYTIVFLILFVSFREILGLYINSYIKFVPDLIIWLMFLYLVIKRKFRVNVEKYDIYFVFFLVVGFISTMINHVSILSYMLQFRSITSIYVLYFVLRNVNISKEILNFACKEILFISAILTVLSIVEFITNKCVMFPQKWALSIQFYSNYERVYSLLNNPNTYAMYLLMSIMLVSSFNKRNLKVHYALYSLFLTGILLSGSRSAFISLIILILFFVVHLLKERKYSQFLCFFAAVFISVISVVLLTVIKESFNVNCKCNERFIFKNDSAVNNSKNNTPSSNTNPNEQDKILGKEDKDSNNGSNVSIINRWEETFSGVTQKNSAANGRIYNIKLGLKIFKDNSLIGTGFGTFGSSASRLIEPKLYKKYNISSGFYADNDYIKIIVETGILGVISFTFFALSLLNHYRKNMKQLLLLFIFFLNGMFYNITELQVLCIVLWFSILIFDEGENLNE